MITHGRALAGVYTQKAEVPPTWTPADAAVTPEMPDSSWLAEEARLAAGWAQERDIAALLDLMRNDLAIECGTIDHPDADGIWEQALDRGRDGGLPAVCLVYMALAKDRR
jgi:hypothetical protein